MMIRSGFAALAAAALCAVAAFAAAQTIDPIRPIDPEPPASDPVAAEPVYDDGKVALEVGAIDRICLVAGVAEAVCLCSTDKLAAELPNDEVRLYNLTASGVLSRRDVPSKDARWNASMREVAAAEGLDLLPFSDRIIQIGARHRAIAVDCGA